MIPVQFIHVKLLEDFRWFCVGFSSYEILLMYQQQQKMILYDIWTQLFTMYDIIKFRTLSFKWMFI